jgi:hypothetical protein
VLLGDAGDVCGCWSIRIRMWLVGSSRRFPGVGAALGDATADVVKMGIKAVMMAGAIRKFFMVGLLQSLQ